MFDFFRAKGVIEKILVRYCFQDRKAAIREIFYDSAFLSMFKQHKTLQTQLTNLVRLINRQSNPILRLKLLILGHQVLMRSSKSIQTLKNIQIFEKGPSSNHKINNAETLVQKSILTSYETFILKICSHHDLYHKAHAKTCRDNTLEHTMIQECFLLINLIATITPISNSLLKAGRYYLDYQVFIDLNIQLCKQIMQLYNLLKEAVDYLMMLHKSKFNPMLLEIIKESQKINEHLFVIFCNRYFYPFIRRYKIESWVQPNQEEIESLSSKEIEPKRERKMRSICEFTRVQVSVQKQPRNKRNQSFSIQGSTKRNSFFY